MNQSRCWANESGAGEWSKRRGMTGAAALKAPRSRFSSRPFFESDSSVRREAGLISVFIHLLLARQFQAAIQPLRFFFGQLADFLDQQFFNHACQGRDGWGFKKPA